MRLGPITRAPSALLVVALAAPSALAQPHATALRHPDPPFSLSVPAGFEPFAADRPPAGFVACFRRFSAGPAAPPTVLVVSLLGEEVPQRPLRTGELAALRRSDPPPFRFVDRAVHVRALGFELDALRGESRQGAQSAVRLSTAVPVEGPSGVDSVLVTVLAPADRAPEAERVFTSVAWSFRARSSWRTPAERVRARVQQVAGITALALSLGYLVGALALWRKQTRWIPARRAMLSVMALAWSAYAAGYLVARPERLWTLAIQAALLAVASVWQARNLRGR